VTVVEDPPSELSPAAFAAALERVNPRDPIAHAWRWRLAGGGNTPDDTAPLHWNDAEAAYAAWHSRAAAAHGGVRSHLEALRRRGPEPRTPVAIDPATASVEWRCGVMALLEALVDSADVTPGRRGRWQEDVRRLRELLADIRGA
jgi:hypothetical protein